MIRSYSKILILLCAVLAIIGGMLLTENQLPMPPEQEDEDLVAERQRDERPNLYDYTMEERREEARKRARRTYWRQRDYSQSDSDIYYYHHQYGPYEASPE